MHMFLIKLQNLAPHLRTICAIVSAKKKSGAIPEPKIFGYPHMYNCDGFIPNPLFSVRQK